MISDKLKLGRLEVFTIVIVFLFSFLRLSQLDLQSFWLDELYTMRSSNPEYSWDFLLIDVAKNQRHPPLYFILARLWMSFIGFNEFGLRSFSAITSILSFIPLFGFVERISNKRAAFFSVLLIAVSSILFDYAQDGRSYSLTFFLMLISSYLAVSYEFLQRKLWIILIGISNGLLLLNSFFGFFYLFASFSFLCYYYFNNRTALLNILISFVISILIYLPWISSLIDNLGLGGLWIPEVTIETFYTSWLFLFGQNILISLLILVIFLTAIITILYRVLILKRDQKQFTALFWFFSISVGSYLVSILLFPIFYYTYSVYFYFPIIIIISIFLESLKFFRMGLVFFVLLFSLFSYRILNDLFTVNSKTPWRLIQSSVSKYFNVPILSHVPEFEIFDYYKVKFNLPINYIKSYELSNKIKEDSLIGWWEMGLHVPVIYFDTLNIVEKTKYSLISSLENGKTRLYWNKDNFVLPDNANFNNITELRSINDGMLWKFDSISRGKYKVIFTGLGIKKHSVYPSVQVLVNGIELAKFTTFAIQDFFSFVLIQDSLSSISISMKVTNLESFNDPENLRITPPVILNLED